MVWEEAQQRGKVTHPDESDLTWGASEPKGPFLSRFYVCVASSSYVWQSLSNKVVNKTSFWRKLTFGVWSRQNRVTSADFLMWCHLQTLSTQRYRKWKDVLNLNRGSYEFSRRNRSDCTQFQTVAWKKITCHRVGREDKRRREKVVPLFISGFCVAFVRHSRLISDVDVYVLCHVQPLRLNDKCEPVEGSCVQM